MPAVATIDEGESEVMVGRVCLVTMSRERSAKFTLQAPVAKGSLRKLFLRLFLFVLVFLSAMFLLAPVRRFQAH